MLLNQEIRNSVPTGLQRLETNSSAFGETIVLTNSCCLEKKDILDQYQEQHLTPICNAILK